VREIGPDWLVEGRQCYRYQSQKAVDCMCAARLGTEIGGWTSANGLGSLCVLA
jgi:hypothetical protein